MSKVKTSFFCQNCGTESSKWIGKCPACGEWNTYVEETIKRDEKKSSWSNESGDKKSTPKLISYLDLKVENRIVTADPELNRVLGGGVVPGSLILLGGDPGIGKSTLMLQIVLELNDLKTLYVSGEESEAQIKMRAERTGMNNNNCYILTETELDAIFQQIKSVDPDVLIIDSIQTLSSPLADSSPGSVTQVRQCTAELLKYAKESNTPVFLVGHITKDGMIAGPKILEHMVDTVLQFEGDRHYNYRIIRTMKNRFGSTSELGIYEMTDSGLRQVSNPSEILIPQRDHDVSGVIIGATIEGNRPLLIEIQALVSPATYGTPQRSTTGFDLKRLNMLLAVLEKRGGFRLGSQDVFLNIAGGLRVEDPALDLAVCMAIISSLEEIPVPHDYCFSAEVGLAGEIRAVTRIQNRISEAAKLGFESIILSKYNSSNLPTGDLKISIKPFIKLSDVIHTLIR
ncbi:DNA repair protein RadA [Bacteroidota bacterium]